MAIEIPYKISIKFDRKHLVELGGVVWWGCWCGCEWNSERWLFDASPSTMHGINNISELTSIHYHSDPV